MTESHHFEAFMQAYQDMVYTTAVRLLGNEAEAQDVSQEVFLKAYRGIAGFREGSSLKTWLYRIAVRQALNHRRWVWRHLRCQSSMDAVEAETGRPLEFRAPGASPFDELATRETQQAVRRALLKVSQQFRMAVILRDLEGMSYEEIAEVLEISVGTVKSRILRGRRALRDLLGPAFAAGRMVP